MTSIGSSLALLVLLCSVSHADYYVSSTYGDDSSDCSEESPCLTIQRAHDISIAQASSSFHLFLDPGQYVGSGNTNLNLGVPASIQMWQGRGSEPVVLDGNTSDFRQTCITAQNNLTLSNITIASGFESAIESYSSVTIIQSQIESPLFINYSPSSFSSPPELTIENSMIKTTLTTNVNNTIFTNSIFQGDSINFASLSVNITTVNIKVTDCEFYLIDTFVIYCNMANISGSNFHDIAGSNGHQKISIQAKHFSETDGHVVIANTSISSTMEQQIVTSLIVNTTSLIVDGLTIETTNAMSAECSQCQLENINVKSYSKGVQLLNVQNLLFEKFNLEVLSNVTSLYVTTAPSTSIMISNGTVSGGIVANTYDEAVNVQGTVKDVEFTLYMRADVPFTSVGAKGEWNLANLKITNRTVFSLFDVRFRANATGSVIISDCEISNVQSTTDLIYVEGSSTNIVMVNRTTFTNNWISGQTADGVGALIYGKGPSVAIYLTNSTFVNNTLISTKLSPLIITKNILKVQHCLFDNNVVGTQASVLDFGYGDIAFSAFQNHKTFVSIIILRDTLPYYYASIRGCEFHNNNGTAVITGPGNLEIKHSNFTNSINSQVFVSPISECILYVENCIFSENSNTQGNGSSIYYDAGQTYKLQINIQSSTFTNNTAMNGGALYFNPGGKENEILNVALSSFSGNTATEIGGAIYTSLGGSNPDYLAIDRCNFTNNIGSAVYLESTARFNSLMFTGNTLYAVECGLEVNIEWNRITIDGSTSRIGISDNCYLDGGPNHTVGFWVSIYVPLSIVLCGLFICTVSGISFTVWKRRRAHLIMQTRIGLTDDTDLETGDLIMAELEGDDVQQEHDNEYYTPPASVEEHQETNIYSLSNSEEDGDFYSLSGVALD